MITLAYILPHPSLSFFVRRYHLLEFQTGTEELVRPWHATLDNYIVFFLQDKPLYLKNQKTGYYVEGSRSADLVGIATQFNGLMKFKGKYKCFGIEFTPNGLAALFKIPLSECANRIYEAGLVFGPTANELLDQLQGTSQPKDMACFADNFLFKYLAKISRSPAHDRASSISNALSFAPVNSSIKTWAGIANMSLRNFERNFKEQVGISPKEYAKLLRYENALRGKATDPFKSWTTIAYECGYFDQAHMLKDFYQFSGTGPKDLFNTIPPPKIDKCYLISR